MFKLPRSRLLTFTYHTFTNLRRSLLIGDRNYNDVCLLFYSSINSKFTRS
ncbi:MAG: hypothetical protein V7L03_08415 [Nostoc sp.]